MSPVVLLLGLGLLFGLLSALVGESKGRTRTGFVLGFLLDLIGLLITAVLPKTGETRAEELAFIRAALTPAAGSAAATSLADVEVHSGMRRQPFRALRVPLRWGVIGAATAGAIGGAAGLVVGLLAYPPTAWFAIFELGTPAAIVGGLLGLASGAIASASRRLTAKKR